ERSLTTNLEQEAIKITDELGRVVFVGALAVNHYSDYRTTKDIDLAMAGPLDEQKLVHLGYARWSDSKETSWLSPRGIKVDFYTRDVGRIPVTWILDHAVQVKARQEGDQRDTSGRTNARKTQSRTHYRHC